MTPKPDLSFPVLPPKPPGLPDAASWPPTRPPHAECSALRRPSTVTDCVPLGAAATPSLLRRQLCGARGLVPLLPGAALQPALAPGTCQLPPPETPSCQGHSWANRGTSSDGGLLCTSGCHGGSPGAPVQPAGAHGTAQFPDPGLPRAAQRAPCAVRAGTEGRRRGMWPAPSASGCVSPRALLASLGPAHLGLSRTCWKAFGAPFGDGSQSGFKFLEKRVLLGQQSPEPLRGTTPVRLSGRCSPTLMHAPPPRALPSPAGTSLFTVWTTPAPGPLHLPSAPGGSCPGSSHALALAHRSLTLREAPGPPWK